MKVAVIGAGPAGLTAAYQLTKSRVEVDVFEASSAVGGFSRTLDLWGQKVDVGPHRFFSSDARVNRLWLEIVGRDYEMVDRLTRIFYRGRFFHYPLKPFDTLGNLGIADCVRCLASYTRQQVLPMEDYGTFESWVTRRFGRALFEIFFKTYSEKLWGIGCDELDADFAAQRIKKLTLFEVIKNALLAGNGNTHKTLVDRFAYPLGGTGMVYERMADAVRNGGNRVLLDTPVRRVRSEGERVTGIELMSGEILHYDHVISTMPLTSMVKGLDEVPDSVRRASDSLSFRNTILVYLRLQAAELFPDNWLYVHSPDLGFGRVTNFRNWVPSLNGDASDTILALEYWCFDQDAVWTEKDEALVARASSEIARTGLTRGAPVLEGKVLRLPRCYPVYRRGYKEVLAPVVAYLSRFSNLVPIGRYGAFKYNNQDHSLLMGLLAAENLTHGKKHDLWSVNTDYDTYQESSRITETGLELDSAQPEAA